MYENGRKIGKQEQEKRRKKKREQEYIKKRKDERQRKRSEEVIEEEQTKRTERMEMRSEMSSGNALDEFDGRNSIGDDKEDPLGDRNEPPYESLKSPHEDTKYPDLEEDRKSRERELEEDSEKEDSFMQKTVSGTKAMGVKLWKAYKTAQATGSVVSFIGAFFVPILVTVFLFFFFVIPMILFLLPTGALIVLTDDEPEGERTEQRVEADTEDKKETKNKNSGTDDPQSKKELIKDSIYPATKANYVTSGFGGRDSPGGIGSTNHKGTDLAYAGGDATGIDVQAYQNGSVIMRKSVAESGGFGNLVVIQHSDSYRTYYAHLNSFNIKQGDDVTAGDKIGEIGTTGNSTGAHLHFEVRLKTGEDYVQQDPKSYLVHFGLDGIYRGAK